MSLKILLADDSLTAQNMGKKILTEAGYDVIAVSNGAQALKKIASELPDLVVLDVYMPGYSGVELCERMRNSRETARIPIVLSVGKMEAFKPEEVTRVRADGLIIKPFEASELLAVVKKLGERVPPRPKRQSHAESEPQEVAELTPSEPTPHEPEFVVSHPAVDIPQEMASTPVIGMDLIPEETPAPGAPAAADPIEFEVEREPEPVKIEEGPRMASAAGLSGVFEMEPTAHPAVEEPAAPAPVEEFERFPSAPEASAASQPSPELAADAGATTVEHDFPELQTSGGEAECAPQSGPLTETWSAPAAEPGSMEYVVEGLSHFHSEPTVQSTPPPSPDILPELMSWEEPATSLHGSAQQLTVAAPVWVAEEAEIEPDDLAIPLHQQMQREAQASEPHEFAPPASPAASAADSVRTGEVPEKLPEPLELATEIPTHREAPIQPEFEPYLQAPVEHAPEIQSAHGLANSTADHLAGEAQLIPEPVAAPEMEPEAAPAPEFPPQATVPTVIETAADPARIASIVEQALERLKPELIAAVTRELEQKNQ